MTSQKGNMDFSEVVLGEFLLVAVTHLSSLIPRCYRARLQSKETSHHNFQKKRVEYKVQLQVLAL